MMTWATTTKNDGVAGKTPVATIVTFTVASCTNPVRWTSTTMEFWRCPCCKQLIAPGQTHRCFR